MFEVGWASQDMTPVRPAMIQSQKHRRIRQPGGGTELRACLY